MTLRDAQLDDRDRLERLLGDYLFEFDGRTGRYPQLAAYWAEPERLPLLIEVDGEVVGMCLIRRREGGWSIAEFSVLPARRRDGVGRAAVDALAPERVRRGLRTSRQRFTRTIARHCRFGSPSGSPRFRGLAPV